MKRKATWAIVAVFMVAGPLSAQVKRSRPVPKRPAVGIPSSFQLPGWLANGVPRKLTGKALADLLSVDRRAALQYGVKDLTVHRFKPAVRAKRTAGTELTIEVYRMASPEDAFGLFTFDRRITDLASSALPVPNAIGEDHAIFAKSHAFVEILTKGCDQAVIEKLAATVAGKIGLPSASPPHGIAQLPRPNLVPGSERYLKGDIAAGAESPLLNRDFWGFKAGTSRGYAARYAPKDSKLIIVVFAEVPGGLAESVLALFKEYLEDVRQGDGLVVGADVSGGVCLFRLAGKTAALIIGEPDRAAADARLIEALVAPGEEGPAAVSPAKSAPKA